MEQVQQGDVLLGQALPQRVCRALLRRHRPRRPVAGSAVVHGPDHCTTADGAEIAEDLVLGVRTCGNSLAAEPRTYC
ncbi:hypothetical protein AB0O22_27605 [Streptomyces sp. NPDC091204]|uniref:hypothetical protein n=1 Tax=Streptomyces sp. NPDC091204 TaxID=3155299 RepID=UPI00341FF619